MMSQLGRPIMSKDLSNHTRHASNTPAVKRGRTRVSPVPDMTTSSPEGPSAPCHPACLLFTITSEQDNGGHWHAPLQNLSLIYGCSARHQVWWSQPGPCRQARPNKRPRRRHQTTFGGARRDRTDDLKLAKLALSQLSYGPNSVTSTQTKNWLA